MLFITRKFLSNWNHWNQNEIYISKTLIRPSDIYGSESWTSSLELVWNIDVLESKILETILRRCERWNNGEAGLYQHGRSCFLNLRIQQLWGLLALHGTRPFRMTRRPLDNHNTDTMLKINYVEGKYEQLKIMILNFGKSPKL